MCLFIETYNVNTWTSVGLLVLMRRTGQFFFITFIRKSHYYV